MNFKRVMLAAPKSGSGKTIITCALLQALKDQGFHAVSYKCGPDYIDPMFHKTVIGVSSKNLDTFFTDEETTRTLLLHGRNEEDFAILEGVMGLYDGLGGIREEGSSYHLAKVTKTPIILVVDAKGIGKSVMALIAGFLAYDEAHLIQGVILNRMSRGYYDIIKPLIEKELNIAVVGYFPDQKKMFLESRHLGLVLPDELPELKMQLKEISKELTKTVSLDSIRRIAQKAENLEEDYRLNQLHTANEKHKAVIAVAKDEAFCFYYADNLQMLEDCGAELIFFSPIHDQKLPDKCDAILIGGGYPELYLKELSENTSMRTCIQQAFHNKMPIVAECGGFMYLHSAIKDNDSREWKTTDIIPGICENKKKLVRFGYIELKDRTGSFLPKNSVIKGHEFHYYDSTKNGENCLARKPVTGKEYSCIIAGEYYWLGFPHLYYPSNPAFAEAFVEKAAKYRKYKNIN